jgi:hypothetical protein
MCLGTQKNRSMHTLIRLPRRLAHICFFLFVTANKPANIVMTVSMIPGTIKAGEINSVLNKPMRNVAKYVLPNAPMPNAAVAGEIAGFIFDAEIIFVQ